uniref:Uncharacterized protein n=1 Tax=Hericium coralloides TaxID=100756 RepID=A0A1P8NNI9_HERCO|nr:hypothetical protein [Hericium coralloides]APX41090.1 hypothetical protein [Hericium coralloides]
MYDNKIYYWNEYKVYILKHKYKDLYDHITINLCIWKCDSDVKLLQLIYDNDRKSLFKFMEIYIEYNNFTNLQFYNKSIDYYTINNKIILKFNNDLNDTKNKYSKALDNGDYKSIKNIKLHDLIKLVTDMNSKMSYIDIVEKNLNP